MFTYRSLRELDITFLTYLQLSTYKICEIHCSKHVSKNKILLYSILTFLHISSPIFNYNIIGNILVINYVTITFFIYTELP